MLSFVAGKAIDVGEIGAVACAPELRESLLKLAAHPGRQSLSGLSPINTGGVTLRPDPVAAIRLWHALSTWSRQLAAQAREHAVDAHLMVDPAAVPLGHDGRRENVTVPVAFHGAGRSPFALDLACDPPVPMPGVLLASAGTVHPTERSQRHPTQGAPHARI